MIADINYPESEVQAQAQLHDSLLELTPAASPEPRAAWEATANPALAAPAPWQARDLPEQYLILVTCRDEKHRRNCSNASGATAWSASRCCRDRRPQGSGLR
jgi:hypothetical protein